MHVWRKLTLPLLVILLILISREDAEKARSLIKMVGSRPVQIVFAKQREPRKKASNKNDSGVKNDAKNSEETDSDAINRDNVDGVTINRDSGVSDGEELVETVDQTDSEDDYEALTAKQNSVVGGASSNNDRVRGKNKRKTERGGARFDTGRVVVLSGLPEGEMTEKMLRKECERIGKMESIQCPVPGREIPSAYITYSTHKEARIAVGQLNGRSFGGEGADSTEFTARLLSREGKGVSKKSLKKSRLIVRNLSFKCSEAELRRTFEKYGQLLEAHVPRKPNGHMLG
jgi:RNA recognition motif-containing protein